jgi:hypothetical protein
VSVRLVTSCCDVTTKDAEQSQTFNVASHLNCCNIPVTLIDPERGQTTDLDCLTLPSLRPRH